MTLQHLTSLLQCPDCGVGFTYEAIAQNETEAGNCGLLRCSCSSYPVLDDVPILKQGRLVHRSIADDRVVASGPLPADLVGLTKAGRALDGLVDLLTFPVCPWPLNRVGVFRRFSLREPHHALGLSHRRRHVRRMLARRRALVAEDWLAAFYWHAPAPYDPFNYFFFRFGQPRHLATLSLLSVLPKSETPLLDLACGYGHFLHTVATGGHSAVGLDQNFHQTWVARHYIAPDAAFVCANAARPLPFQTAAFSSTLCADAFEHLGEKRAIVDEISRCVGDGPVILASLGNRLAGQHDGEELSPEEYVQLWEPRRTRALAEDELLIRYLKRLGPDLRISSTPEALNASRYVYVLATRDEALFVEHAPFEAWPHAAGEIGVNPIYHENDDQLRFRFPSPWFGFENKGMRDYMPETASRHDDRETLLAGAVLVGLPLKYARAKGRPWPVEGNRQLLDFVRRLRSS